MNVRKTFLKYFSNNSHLILPSFSVIPKNDSSLLFINSGMAPLKEFFLGTKNPPSNRLTMCQKCIRAGGKHNDLDEVGYTKRHHTFFEMLGNFSFGAYSKSEAIEYAWKFLTQTLSLSEKKLWITVHPQDEITKKIWQKFTSQIVELEENVWSVGDEGPCGMCSEIFYDHGSHIQGTIEQGDRFVEIWNLVFMSHEMRNNEKFELPQLCIDTGMGLERMEGVLHNTNDNFEIPFFKNLLNIIQNQTNTDINASCKILADHSRSVSIMISDGILPSSESQGYVLRRILRRALRHEFNLGDKSIMNTCAQYVIEQMQEIYSELKKYEEVILSNIDTERKQFKEICINGTQMLNDYIKKESGILSGKFIFKLYDTYGLPIDIAKDIAREKNRDIDIDELQKCIHESKKQYFQINKSTLPSEKIVTHFDYDSYEMNSKVVGIVPQNSILWIALDFTPFYAESGGQQSDIGYIQNNNTTLKVINVQKNQDTIWHECVIEKGIIKKGESVTAKIDQKRRKSLTVHHSSTHLLLAELNRYFDHEVVQKGSLVTDEYFRLDFLSSTGLSRKTLNQLESNLNHYITQNIAAEISYMSYEEAKSKNITATFGEKYPNIVRTVTFKSEEKIISAELCGGTHVNNTGEIGSIYLLNEKGISANTRRIEGVAGSAAIKYAQKLRFIVNDITQLTQSTESTVIAAIKKQLFKQTKSSGKFKLHFVSEKIAYAISNEYDNAMMRQLADTMQKKHPISIIIDHGKTLSFMVRVRDDHSYSAVNILNEIIKKCEGRGGGKQYVAFGSGKVHYLQQIIDYINELNLNQFKIK